MFLTLLLAQAAFAGQFLQVQETVDRVVDGAPERSYIVIFNEKGPYFGMNIEKLRSWLEFTIPGVKSENVQHIYEITNNFRGYAVWANNATLSHIIEHEGTKYVEEDCVMRINAPFIQRPDWGQIRSNQPGARNLATTPANLYNQTTYPPAGNDTTTWDWTNAVYNTWSQKPNNGNRAMIWVVDTGVLSNHQEFTNNGPTRVIRNHDVVTPNGNAQDCHGHGTHCAGSAGGAYRGVSNGAALGNVRVLNCQGSGTNANVVAGFNYVSNNQITTYAANIMSVSLGGGANQASDDAVTNAINNGVIAVIAAGNDNANACNYSPARTPAAITVMASDKNDARASFTNTGSCGDVFAPGVTIHSGTYTSNTAYTAMSGTSMATPLTAGAIGVYVTAVGTTRGTAAVKSAINSFGTRGMITGSLLAGTPNIVVNAQWR